MYNISRLPRAYAARQGNTMKMNLYKSAAVLLGLCFFHIQASAFSEDTLSHNGNFSKVYSQSDKAFVNPDENQLEQIYETRSIADNVWNELTNEFVTVYEAGNYAQAAAVAKHAYDLAMANFGKDHVNTADSMLKMGIINQTLGNIDAAKQYMLDAMAILKVKLGPYHEDVAIVLTNLANLYFEQNQPQQSEIYHKQALEIRVRALGENDPAVAQSMYNLAVLYDDEKKYQDAARLYQSALEIWNTNYNGVHPYIANALNNLANVYMAMERYDDAIKLHKQSLAIRRTIYGENNAEVARALINLGALYVKQSAYDKAEPMYVEAVHVAEKIFGPDHPQVAMLLYSLANIYHIEGRMAKAESQQVSAVKDGMTPVANSSGAQSMAKATKVSVNTSVRAKLEKSAQTKFKQAVPLYERALAILDTSMGGNHPAVTAMINELAMLYKSIGENSKAKEMQARLSSDH